MVYGYSTSRRTDLWSIYVLYIQYIYISLQYTYISIQYIYLFISKLDRKINEYIRGKMDAQDMILDDITWKQLIWYGHVKENRTNATTKNYDSLET
jgi:hypothetical protein